MTVKKRKTPKYVSVYNQILSMINKGIYNGSEKLPSETELSETLQVSRMTLRQALVLLREDGIIETRHGSGNYIKRQSAQSESGIEKQGDPVLKISKCEISNIESEIELRATEEFTSTIFQRDAAISIAIRRFYYNEDNKCVAYGFTTLLSDILDETGINISNPKNIEEFLETKIYEKAHKTHLEMKIMEEHTSIPVKQIPSHSHMYFSIVELIYDNSGKVMAYTKYYTPVENTDMVFNRYQ